MSEYKFSPEQKNASGYTIEKNKAFAAEFGIDTENAINEEVLFAREGLIKDLSNAEIKDENGKTVWNLKPYSFLKEKAAADTVHPSLWLNGKANIEAGVFEVVKGKIYQIRGIDVANLTFVRTHNGWIALDVMTNTQAAAFGLNALEEAIGENVRDNIKAVIISHSHVDHYGGIKGVIDEKNVGKEEGKIRIFVPDGFDIETVKENVYAGTAMMHRGKYQFGTDLHPDAKGTVSTGLGLTTSKGTVSYIRPTDFISEDTSVVIDGLTVEFQITPGTEAPSEMNNYFPEYRAFWAAENCTGTLHNLYPIRGAQLRDASNWWRFTKVALEKYGKISDVVFQSHNWPHRNTPERPHAVEMFLRNNAAVYKFIHDRTLHFANQGYTAKQIAGKVRLPEKLNKVWYTRPYYGSIEINSRAVYTKYLGFYNGNPTDLDPLTETEEAKLFVDYVGSEEKVLEIAAEDLRKGNYKRAAKAASYVVYANPENIKARYLNADAFEQLAYSSESGIWRNAYLSGAHELRNGTNRDAREIEKSGKNDIISNMTPSMVLDYLGIVTDSEKLADKDIKFRLLITDPEKSGNGTYFGKPAEITDEFTVHIFHGTVLYYNGHTDDELSEISIPEKLFPVIISGNAEAAKKYADTDRYDIIDLISGAVTDLNSHSQFGLIEPLND